MVAVQAINNFLTNPKNKRLTTLPSLSQDDISSIWDLVSNFVVAQMRLRKGVCIPNLGTFSFTSIKLDIGNNKHVLTQRPVFLVSEKFAQLHRLEYAKYYTTGEVAIATLNYIALSLESKYDRDTVELCVREMLQSLSRAVANSQNIQFLFRNVGVFSIKNGKVKMKFFRDFVNSLDCSGNLLKSLENRPGTSASVMTTQTTLSAHDRPGTRTLTLPKLNKAQELLPPISENEPEKENEEKTQLPPSRQMNREVMRPHTVQGVSSMELSQQLPRDQVNLPPKISASTHRSSESFKPTPDVSGSRKACLEMQSSSQFSESCDPAVHLQAPMPPADVLLSQGRSRRSRSQRGSWVCSSPDGHRLSPDQRLCPLCHWRATRNISMIYEEERRRKLREEDALLAQYQQAKDQEYTLLEEAKKNSTRQDNQKVAAFNLGVAEGIKEMKKERKTKLEKSYVFQHRPLTPLPYKKRAEYGKELESQVKFRKSREDREKMDDLFQEKLEQVQLAEDLAAQRDQFVRVKADQILQYQRALDAQVDSQKRFYKELKNAGVGDVADTMALPRIGSRLYPYRISQYSGSTLSSEEIRGKHPQLPKYESDSKMPIFGKYDSNNFRILDEKERARNLMKDQMEAVAEKKRKILVEEMNRRKEDNEALKKDRKEMVAERVKQYARDVKARKTLEKDWKEHHLAKVAKEEEERLRMSDAGLLLLEKMKNERACGQCQRDLKNCGESNQWSESRFLAGSNIMM